MTAQPASTSKVSFATLAVVALLALAALWAYWTTLEKMAWRWWEDPQYSHGYLVPIFAVYLLWSRRDRLGQQTLHGSWLGLGFLGVAAGLRLAGARFHLEYLDQISLLPCCAGLFMLAGGWTAFYSSWPAVAFLTFMVPLPHTVSLAMSAPMQALATTASTFCLQVIGRPAIAEGNVILLNDVELGIVEACSGLRMLVVFFAQSTAVAMLIRKPFWEKCLVAGSAVPIALLTNILRITVTGVAYDTLGNERGLFCHDLAGYLMPFVGFLFLGIELWILKTLLIERPTDVAMPTQITMQRVEVSPLAMYQSSAAPRREKTPKAEAEATPTPEVDAETAAAEPAVQA